MKNESITNAIFFSLNNIFDYLLLFDEEKRLKAKEVFTKSFIQYLNQMDEKEVNKK